MILMRCVSLANGEPGPSGQFLKSFDPQTGFSEWTFEMSDAMQFATQAEAWDTWRTVHAKDPVRSWDGQPNRPLTAFTVEIGEF
jgi:hypothetical protein